jgi:hypothetical protein
MTINKLALTLEFKNGSTVPVRKKVRPPPPLQPPEDFGALLYMMLDKIRHGQERDGQPDAERTGFSHDRRIFRYCKKKSLQMINLSVSCKSFTGFGEDGAYHASKRVLSGKYGGRIALLATIWPSSAE